MRRSTIFSSIAMLIAVYHGILGVVGTFASEEMAARVIKLFYGVDLNFGTQTLYLVKFTSALMLAFAVTMYLLAKNPREYRHLVWVPIIYFGIRIFDRIFFFEMLREGFGMTIQRDLITVVIIGTLAVLLYVFRPKHS